MVIGDYDMRLAGNPAIILIAMMLMAGYAIASDNMEPVTAVLNFASRAGADRLLRR